MAEPARPSVRSRLVVATAVAVAAGVFTWVTHGRMMAQGTPPDSLVAWRAASLLAAGLDPYDAATWGSAMPTASLDAGAWRVALDAPLYYPLPALLPWLPLAAVPFRLASALFMTVGAFLFAWAVTRDALVRAWLCGGVPFLVALTFGQWSPFVAAALVLPWLAPFAVAKPNIGAPVIAARPSRLAVVVALAVLLGSIALLPSWPAGWLANVRGGANELAPHPAPITTFGGAGVLALVALLRWRTWEGRLVAAMACVPQLPFWADQLALGLVARTRREVLGVVLVTLLGFLAWAQFAPKVTAYVPVMQPYALLATYVPALVLVLRRPNVGEIPSSVERAVALLGEAVRGALRTRSPK